MEASYIKPFIASIQNVFATMLQLPVSVGTPRLKEDQHSQSDVSGIIGLSGDVTGSVVLSFPRETAERIVALFTGTPLTVDSPDFADAVGELVNMVSGGAKAMFTGKKASISCPSVVVGSSHVVAGQSDTPCVVIPCTTDCGALVIEIAIRDSKAAQAQPAAAASARA